MQTSKTKHLRTKTTTKEKRERKQEQNKLGAVAGGATSFEKFTECVSDGARCKRCFNRPWDTRLPPGSISISIPHAWSPSYADGASSLAEHRDLFICRSLTIGDQSFDRHVKTAALRELTGKSYPQQQCSHLDRDYFPRNGPQWQPSLRQ